MQGSASPKTCARKWQAGDASRSPRSTAARNDRSPCISGAAASAGNPETGAVCEMHVLHGRCNASGPWKTFPDLMEHRAKLAHPHNLVHFVSSTVSPGSASSPFWWLALLPLLLTAALAIPLLNHDAFNGDETIFLVTAGALQDGIPSPQEVWHSLPPRVAAGWPVLLSLWGWLTGWSEPAVRSLACLVGLLTIAMVYRAGRDLFAPQVGVVAAFLLTASVFHHAYMVHAVPYIAVAFFTTLTLWGYWMVAMRPGVPGRGAQASLLLGSVGLVCTHFLAALLLPVVALYHLLFARRGDHWWRACLLLLLAAAIGAMQLPLLPEALAFTSSENIGNWARSTRNVLSHLLYVSSNGILNVEVSIAFVILILSTLLALSSKLDFRSRAASPAGLLVLVGFAFLASILAINELLVFFRETRIRYLMPLWPVAALIAGAGLWQMFRHQRMLSATLLVFWLLQGSYFALATDFRYETGYFFRLDLHHVRRAVSEIVPAGDFLVVDRGVARQDEYPYRYYHFQLMGLPWGIYDRKSSALVEAPEADLHNYPQIWLLYLTGDRSDMTDVPVNLGSVSCKNVFESWGYTLERLAPSATECAGDRAATRPGEET